MTHIGHHMLPNALAQEMKVYAYQHEGYWDVSSAARGGGVWEWRVRTSA